MLARLDAAPDGDSEDEDQGGDDRTAAEETEDLPTVEADLELLHEQLAFARGHVPPFVAERAGTGNFSALLAQRPDDHAGRDQRGEDAERAEQAEAGAGPSAGHHRSRRYDARGRSGSGHGRT